jgi:hypothetical protein
MGKRLQINWNEIFCEYELSGKSKREFCTEKGIAFSTFCKHGSMSKTNVKTPLWVEAKLTEHSDHTSEIAATLEISAGKFKIAVSGCNKDLLSDVLEMVSKLC